MNKKEFEKIQELKHKSRRLSIKEGIFARASFSLGTNYISPFAIAINASNFMIAFLSSLQGLLGPLSQLYGSKLIEKNSRKKIVRKYVLMESFIWILFFGLAILFYKEIITSVLPFLILFFFSLYTILGNVAYPAWFSWMGDLVDAEYRGRWFSKRQLIDGFVSGVMTVSAAIFLDFCKRHDSLIIGFMVLFLLAFFFRLLSVGIFKKQYEPKLKLKKADYFSFWDFLKQAPYNNFGKFSIFRTMLSFSFSISSALIVIYLLRYLNFNYLTYIIILLTGTSFAALLLGFWGKFSDFYGNYKVFRITSFAIPFVPVLWILHSSPIYLALVPSLISGVSWIGFNLSALNFIYDNVSIVKRGLAVSYHNLLNGIGVFLGAGLGAILIKYLDLKFIEPLFAIFILSSFLMIIVFVWWIPKMREVRKIKRMKKPFKVFEEMILKKGSSTISEEFHQIISIKSYLFEK